MCLLLGLTALAQTNTNRELDPLHQFNTAIRKLVRQVTPSVVQIQASGYEPANTPVVLQSERSGKLMFVAFKLSGPE